MSVLIMFAVNEKFTEIIKSKKNILKVKKMKIYDIKIRVQTETPADCQKLGNLIQNAVNVVNHSDMTKLLSKVQQNPSIVKTALKFI